MIMAAKKIIPIEVQVIAYLFLTGGILGSILFVYDLIYDLPNTVTPVFILHFLIYRYLMRLNNSWRIATVIYMGITFCFGLYSVLTLNRDIGIQYAEYTGLSAPFSFGLYFLYLISCLVLTAWAMFALTRDDIVCEFINHKNEESRIG